MLPRRWEVSTSFVQKLQCSVMTFRNDAGSSSTEVSVPVPGQAKSMCRVFRKLSARSINRKSLNSSSSREGEERTFMIRERHINNAEATKRFFTASWSQNKLGPRPALWVDWIEIEGPLYENWPPQNTMPCSFHAPKVRLTTNTFDPSLPSSQQELFEPGTLKSLC